MPKSVLTFLRTLLLNVNIGLTISIINMDRLIVDKKNDPEIIRPYKRYLFGREDEGHHGGRHQSVTQTFETTIREIFGSHSYELSRLVKNVVGGAIVASGLGFLSLFTRHNYRRFHDIRRLLSTEKYICIRDLGGKPKKWRDSPYREHLQVQSGTFGIGRYFTHMAPVLHFTAICWESPCILQLWHHSSWHQQHSRMPFLLASRQVWNVTILAFPIHYIMNPDVYPGF